MVMDGRAAEVSCESGVRFKIIKSTRDSAFFILIPAVVILIIACCVFYGFSKLMLIDIVFLVWFTASNYSCNGKGQFVSYSIDGN